MEPNSRKIKLNKNFQPLPVDDGDEMYPNGMFVFKDESFEVSQSEKSTRAAAIEYGRTLSIPEEQLDFVT